MNTCEFQLQSYDKDSAIKEIMHHLGAKGIDLLNQAAFQGFFFLKKRFI